MTTKININGKDVEITLTADQIAEINRKSADVTERIKSFEDACADQGVNIDEFYENCKGLTLDEIAYRKLKIIARALNEKWEPNWDNSNEYKYYPYFDMRSASSGFGFSHSACDRWITATSCGSRLCFKSEKLAKYAGTQFTSIYKELFTLNNSNNESKNLCASMPNPKD